MMEKNPTEKQDDPNLTKCAQIYQKLQMVSAASREAAQILGEQAKGIQDLIDENRNLRALESVWIEQKRTLENLEVAHRSTLNEVRRCHQVEVESIKRELKARMEDSSIRYRDLESRASETIRSLRTALIQAQQEAKEGSQVSSRRETEQESRINELLARMDADAKVSFEKISEIEKRHQLEKEQLQFDFQKSRSFLLASNQRLEEIALEKEQELEEARKRILILGGDPNRNPEQELRQELLAVRAELSRLENENGKQSAELQARSFEISILRDELTQVRSECAEAREQLDTASGHAELSGNEAALLRANLARVEGVNQYLENENRLLKERGERLEQELKTEKAASICQLQIAEEHLKEALRKAQRNSMNDDIEEIPYPRLDELRDRVEKEREKAALLLKEGASRIISG
jgi:hypothetical protein